ncbi:unnamed protein product [Paramecium octaurelia]|uniref:Uncharacterized protein n=1 Tax=Paramecium octaurelia TaxID=43137 RepID=A0A8S1VIX1_PAROT|nr:unnamed protein product [Paramecium octaurelia]
MEQLPWQEPYNHKSLIKTYFLMIDDMKVIHHFLLHKTKISFQQPLTTNQKRQYSGNKSRLVQIYSKCKRKKESIRKQQERNKLFEKQKQKNLIDPITEKGIVSDQESARSQQQPLKMMIDWLSKEESESVQKTQRGSEALQTKLLKRIRRFSNTLKYI